MDTTDLLNSTDDLIERLYTATWKGSLRFPGCVLCKEDTHYDEKAAGDVDIFELLGDKMYKSWIIRFNPTVYKVPIGVTENCFAKDTDGKRLVNDITKMLQQNGQGNFCSNGSKAHCKNTRREIVCERYKKYQDRSKRKEEPGEDDQTIQPVLRDITLRTGNFNGRNKAFPTKKNTLTAHPTTNNEKCFCRLQIGADQNSYFVIVSNGNAMHCGHPRTESLCGPTGTKKRHFSSDMVETVRNSAYCKTSVGSAMLASAFLHGAHLSRRQCAHLMQSECLKLAFQDTRRDEANARILCSPSV